MKQLIKGSKINSGKLCFSVLIALCLTIFMLSVAYGSDFSVAGKGDDGGGKGDGKGGGKGINISNKMITVDTDNLAQTLQSSGYRTFGDLATANPAILAGQLTKLRVNASTQGKFAERRGLVSLSDVDPKASTELANTLIRRAKLLKSKQSIDSTSAGSLLISQ